MLREFPRLFLLSLAFAKNALFRKNFTEIVKEQTANVPADKIFYGAERDRTADLMLAKHALSQLSYCPGY